MKHHQTSKMMKVFMEDLKRLMNITTQRLLSVFTVAFGIFANETDPHPCFCSILKAVVTGEVCIMTHEWPGPRSQVPNMIRTQPVLNDSL